MIILTENLADLAVLQEADLVEQEINIVQPHQEVLLLHLLVREMMVVVVLVLNGHMEEVAEEVVLAPLDLMVAMDLVDLVV
jgi:hypothetical protein